MKVTNDLITTGEETPSPRPYPDEGEPGNYNHLPQANQSLGVRGSEVSKIKNIFETKNKKNILKRQGGVPPSSVPPPTQHYRVRLEIEKIENKTKKTLKIPRTNPPGPTQQR